MTTVMLPTDYYQQFDADYRLDVPAEGYGGWRRQLLPLNVERTALVVMHAADCGSMEEVPGHFRAVEYLPRSYEVCRTVFPDLLAAVRGAGMKVVHIGMNEHYCLPYSGYARIRELAGDEPAAPPQVPADPVLEQLRQFRADHVFPGKHNADDIRRGLPGRKFPKEAEPRGDEPVVMTTHQLLQWCLREQVNHLIYVGFAINWCLLMSPGGMLDMSRCGVMCSTVRQAVTAVENKETARHERNKESALWRVALAFGFVYDADELIRALRNV